MLSARKQWIIALGLLLAVGATLAWQRHQTRTLETRIREIRDDAGTPKSAGANAAAISASELQRLREDRLALERLQKEIEDLKQSVARQSSAPPRTNDFAQRVPASAWQHEGRTSPQKAVITILWAGKNRNLDVMSSALAFASNAARARAEEVLATLPVGTREFLGTPERLIAHLISQSLDFDAIQFPGNPVALQDSATARNQAGDVETVVLPAVSHRANEGPSRMSLTLQQSLEGWKLVLPEDAVEAYATRLREGTLRLP
jgi:hypothetical protein